MLKFHSAGFVLDLYSLSLAVIDTKNKSKFNRSNRSKSK